MEKTKTMTESIIDIMKRHGREKALRICTITYYLNREEGYDISHGHRRVIGKILSNLEKKGILKRVISLKEGSSDPYQYSTHQKNKNE